MTDVLTRLTTSLSDRYVIERELGAGGMATVYLAHDVRHDRKVALKVLKPELSAILGAERFLKEIRTTANLQHPHILPLHDSGTGAQGHGGTEFVYYVMPFVEGESLRERLEREQQLPVDDALRIAREVLDALAYAHGQGVIHRDIKPENILLYGGHALVADFGIALAASRSEGSKRLTETGMSLGTPAYMAPEQAMGERAITPRVDIYAVGCVLYEMLSGEPPFTGPTAQAIIARVMTEEPRSLTLQRHTIPPHVEASVRKALEKLPADRFETAHAFAEALTNPAFVSSSHEATSTAKRMRNRRATYLVAVSLVTLASLAGWGWFRPARVLPVEVRQIVLDETGSVGWPSDMAVAPDGAAIVWRAAGAGRDPATRIMITERDRVTPMFLETVRNYAGPSFSPDGKWVALIADGRLERVSRTGGAPVVLSDSTMQPAHTAWLDSDTILSLGGRTVFATAAAGGAARRVFTADSTDGIDYIAPVPGADAAVLTIGGGRPRAVALDVRSGRTHDIQPGVSRAWVVGDWLLYTERNGVLYERPFDKRRLAAAGSPSAVIDSVQSAGRDIAIGRNGTLLYVRGVSPAVAEYEFARVALDGRVEREDSAQRVFLGIYGLALSPDGQRAAVTVRDSVGGRLDIYVYDLRGRAPIRLTFRLGGNIYPAWSPDGRWITYGSAGRVWMRRSDGSGPESLLVSEPRAILGSTWSPDGRWIIYRTDNATRGQGDIVAVRTQGDTTRVPLAATPARELAPMVSPDGRWLAYSSDGSGRQEVYVQPFPEAAGAIWQVSTDGGVAPQWSRDGRRIFYVSADGHLVAADLQTAPSFAVVRRRVLFAVPGDQMGMPYTASYAVAPDDRHFVTLVPRSGLSQAAARSRLIEVNHWRPGSGVRLMR